MGAAIGMVANLVDHRGFRSPIRDRKAFVNGRFPPVDPHGRGEIVRGVNKVVIA